jgi:spore maturation protein CgeB
MHLAFLGSSLLSSYWNGAATYYRGIVAALARQGCRTTFFEPDALDRQSHRDIDPPDWAEVVVYPATLDGVRTACVQAARADIVAKTSGVGVFDDELLSTMLAVTSRDKVRLFWDVDAPATLAAMVTGNDDPLRSALPELDAVLTYGGGPPVVAHYESLDARLCVPIYNALDSSTHHPVPPDPRFTADLAFLGNRLPDREARVDSFFFAAARMLPDHSFLIGGAGWEAWQLPPNVRHIGHVPTRDHNAFNCTPMAVMNIARESMASNGHSPATRVFEAAGAGACMITDDWEGVAEFFEPGTEILVARHADDVVRHLTALTLRRATAFGRKALARVLRDHTYDQRASITVALLERLIASKRIRGAA